jgi:hypothetical protein
MPSHTKAEQTLKTKGILEQAARASSLGQSAPLAPANVSPGRGANSGALQLEQAARLNATAAPATAAPATTSSINPAAEVPKPPSTLFDVGPGNDITPPPVRDITQPLPTAPRNDGNRLAPNDQPQVHHGLPDGVKLDFDPGPLPPPLDGGFQNELPIGNNAAGNVRRSNAEFSNFVFTGGTDNDAPTQLGRNNDHNNANLDDSNRVFSLILNQETQEGRDNQGAPTNIGNANRNTPMSLTDMLNRAGMGGAVETVLEIQRFLTLSREQEEPFRQPLGGGREGTVRLLGGGQAAAASVQEAVNMINQLALDYPQLQGFTDRLLTGTSILDQRFNDHRNEAIAFTVPFQQAQRRAIALSNEIQTGKRRPSSSSTIPLAAGLLTRKRNATLAS